MADRADDSGSRRVDAAIAEYLELIERGAPVDCEAFIARHAEIGGELREFLADYHALELPRAGSFSGRSALGGAGDSAGRRFGDYELLEEIARGGMGVVYKARQLSLDRTVAVKMILSGRLASQTEVARFFAEAHAAANLDHPNIVPVFEVGERDGQHFYSMGYVAGQTLAQRLAGSPLPPREAARMLRDVALAVQYAHGKGVIHRDLKPANILIEADQRVRITDFGLAALPTNDRGLTVTGQILGTPNFMSPEQVAGRKADVGPGADVYSLGATLYALLTGRPPFQAASTVDLLKQVIEKEPVPPRQLDASLPRDLETIALKCLEKDRARRYSSAGAVADDLQRFLDGRAIEAAPPSVLYQIGKFARRNRVMVAAGVVAVAALLGGIAMLSVGLSRSRSEARRAQEINRFLVELLASANANYNTGGDATVREALERAGQQIEGKFKDQPRVEMDLRSTIGAAYESLGLKKEALPHYVRVVELAGQLGAEWEEGGVKARCAVLRSPASVEEAAASAPQARRFVEECRTRFGANHALMIDAEDALGVVLLRAREFAEGREAYERALARARADRERHPEEYFQLGLDYGQSLGESGMWREAIGVLEPLIPDMRTTLGAGAQIYIQTVAGIGSNYYELGDFASAERFYRQALDSALQRGGPNHFNSILFQHWLARTLFDLKKHEEAEVLERDSYTRACRVIGSENATTLQIASILALILDARGKYAECEQVLRDVGRARRRTLPEGDPLTTQADYNLAGCMLRQGRPSDAVPVLLEAYKWRDRLPAGDSLRARIPGDLGLVLFETSRMNEAEPYLRESIRVRRERNAPVTKTGRRVFEALAEICARTGREEEARELRAATTSAPAH